ncbi:glycosyltransferase [Bacteriovoracaceae bacterium]|nr:glycosyltransferase [Bacteriovoracaceae bacterium]
MISIITATFNNYEELQDTISALPDERYFEHVIVNGGSCPKTLEFLLDYSKVENTLIINEPDKGIYDAFNKGISRSSGMAVVFHNSGDKLIDKNYWKEAEDFLNNHSEFAFVYSSIQFLDPEVGLIPLEPRGKRLGRGMPYLHPTMVVRREVFKDVGCFNLDYKIAGDYDFIVRMEKKNLEGHFIKGIIVEMEGSGISATNEEQAIKECKKSLIEHELYFKNFIDFQTRNQFFKARKFLASNPFSNKLLKGLKKLKYNCK